LIRWDAQGIQVLYGDSTAFLYEQSSGSSRPLPGVYLPHEGGALSWSSDGRKVAYWHDYCAQVAGFLGGCRISQAFLYVLDVATGTATRVAVHTILGVFWQGVAVSPTGSMVAYTINRGFYLLEVR
jgi:Tol biopolymer transport system component